MREFIDLIESDEYDPAEDEALDQKWAREKHVVEIVRHVFAKLGLDIDTQNKYAVNYDEDGDREITVQIDGIGVSLTALAKLDSMGLGSNFKLSTRGDSLAVEFNVDPDLDHATIE